jgi:hypothetical protein
MSHRDWTKILQAWANTAEGVRDFAYHWEIPETTLRHLFQRTLGDHYQDGHVHRESPDEKQKHPHCARCGIILMYCTSKTKAREYLVPKLTQSGQPILSSEKMGLCCGWCIEELTHTRTFNLWVGGDTASQALQRFALPESWIPSPPLRIDNRPGRRQVLEIEL